MNFLKYYFLIVGALASITLKASDTLKVNLQSADHLFISNNFSLLASSMNIEAQNAQIIQAKLYPNPVFTADLNAYDPESNKVFHIANSGQKFFQLEQLLVLGGKRKSEIEMAKTNKLIAQLEFEHLLRQLKFRLHSDLFFIGQQKKILEKYNSQLSLLEDLLSTYQTQVDKGNIPLKDVVRLKAAYLGLNNDRSELLKQYYEAQTNLQTLLQTNALIEFEFSESEITAYIKPESFENIKNLALANRPDFLIREQDKILAQQYFRHQKKLAVPDVSIFTSYDQRSGFVNNQVNAGLSISLPLWNRNQGNIKASEFKFKEADYNLQAMQTESISNLQNAFAFYTQTVSEYQKAKKLYNEDFEVTVKGMTDNFRQRNISILEFIDFFEAYNDVLTELARIKSQLVASGEQLNLLIGKDIF